VDDPERLVPSNLDGRVFLRALADARTPCQHMIMNLPATALDFLGRRHMYMCVCVCHVALPFHFICVPGACACLRRLIRLGTLSSSSSSLSPSPTNHKPRITPHTTI
jgi:hypothetical protein